MTIQFSFGDSPELADLLLALVIAGKKTATCGALRDVEAGSEPMPEVGRQDIVLDGRGRPAALIETVEVTKKRFNEVDEAFALAEGENDSIDGWAQDHQAFFERNGGWSPDMMLVCERFKLIKVLPRDGEA